MFARQTNKAKTYIYTITFMYVSNTTRGRKHVADGKNENLLIKLFHLMCARRVEELPHFPNVFYCPRRPDSLMRFAIYCSHRGFALGQMMRSNVYMFSRN